MSRITNILAGEKESNIASHIATICILIVLLFGCCLCYEKYYKAVHYNDNYTIDERNINE